MVNNPSWRYLQKLPTQKIINDLFLEKISEIAFSIMEGGQYYDFASNKWLSIESGDLMTSQLLRITDIINRKSNFLRVVEGGEVQYYRVVNFEWMHLLAADKIGQTIGCDYDDGRNEFSFPVGVSIPTIIERALICNSFRNPKFRERRLIYPNISRKIANIIKSTYPSLM